MSCPFTIEVGFDGSCPQSMEGIRQDDCNEFTIFPSWRPEPGISEDGIGRTTRLGLRLINRKASAEPVTINIDWQYHDAPQDAYTSSGVDTCEKYMGYRDFCVVRYPGQNRWEYVLGTVKESVATFRMEAPAGMTEIHWHPPYSYEQGEEFVENLRRREWTTVERAGTTVEGRNIWLVGISDDSPVAKKRFLITARMHAYESGGSYAMEGMVQFLLDQTPWAAEARRDWEFFIVPMVNPDGVHNGLGKLTSPRGVDLQWALPETDDPAHKALRKIVDKVEPMYYCDLHNWQRKDIDGVIDMNARRWRRFQILMPPAREFGKLWTWRERNEHVDLSGSQRVHFRHYCTEKFNCPTVTFETSWFGRRPEDVRAFGYNALRNTLLIDAACRREQNGVS